MIHGRECRVTASIGVATFPDHGSDEQTLTKNADAAMYLAKEEGRGSFRFFAKDLKPHSIERLMLETSLRRALERDEFVLQDNVLFNCSVRDNIALSDPTMSMERVIAAASLAGAHEFILELPEGYDTLVGERGSSLSGGQRQRIAIARTLITDPRILIFDEATSALDYESERMIQQNMKQIAGGRTVFVIAHRLSTVRNSDRIITIERGRIVEDGTHDELIRSNGRYAKLHYLQAGIHDVR